MGTWWSPRTLSEVIKIDTRTGEMLWRMGGSRTHFTFPDSGPPFLRQHGVRVVEGGLVLLDNLGEAEGSRAERYTLDEPARTARLTAVDAPRVGHSSIAGGATQNLTGQHILVAFGDGGVVQEFDSGGALAWQIQGNIGYPFAPAHPLAVQARAGTGSVTARRAGGRREIANSSSP